MSNIWEYIEVKGGQLNVYTYSCILEQNAFVQKSDLHMSVSPEGRGDKDISSEKKL